MIIYIYISKKGYKMVKTLKEKKADKVEKVMHEFGQGKLKSGSGKVVVNKALTMTYDATTTKWYPSY